MRENMNIALRCEFPTNLHINPELLGGEHRITLENRNIIVSLPATYSDPTIDNPSMFRTEAATGRAWNGAECTEISINTITLYVPLEDQEIFAAGYCSETQQSEPSNLPPPNGNQEAIDNLHRKIFALAARAFEYWSRVIRWQTQDALLGAPVANIDSHFGASGFVMLDPLRIIKSGIFIIEITMHSALSMTEWNRIQNILQAGEQPPLWIDAYHDAQRREKVGDFKGALLEIAICIESFLRKKLMDSLKPLPLSEVAIHKSVERWNISDILKNHKKISTLNEINFTQETIDCLKETFEARNAIMHGKTTQFSFSQLKLTLSTVRKIISA